jgi:hypothetical protein
MAYLDLDYPPGKIMTQVHYPLEYHAKLRLMTPQEQAAAFAWADNEIAVAAAARRKIFCSSWICGAIWPPALMPIYLKVARQHPKLAGLFYGVVVQDRVIYRCNVTGEDWGGIHSENPTVPTARGKMYWRL